MDGNVEVIGPGVYRQTTVLPFGIVSFLDGLSVSGVMVVSIREIQQEVSLILDILFLIY